MLSHPSVSVIATFYNLESYAARCVSSILKQTFTDYELILVDDGSTDSTHKVLESFAVSPQVRLLSQQNSGVGMARNLGVSHARGEYVTFVDGDDVVSPYMLEQLISPLSAGVCDMAVGRFVEIPVSKQGESIRWQRDCDYSIVEDSHIVEKVLYWELSAAPIARLAPKTYYEIEPFRRIKYEDIASAGKHYLQAKRIAVLDGAVYGYMLRDGSTVHARKPTDGQLLDYLDAIDDFLGPLDKAHPEYASALAFRRSLEYARAHRLAKKMLGYSAIAQDFDQYIISEIRRLYPLYMGDRRVPLTQRIRNGLLFLSPNLHDCALRLYEVAKKGV